VTLLETFFFLQVLDFMTTFVGMRMGGTELSPFTRWLMQWHMVGGLTVVKLIGFVLGGICIWAGKKRVLLWVNYIFAGIVFWNMLNILGAVGSGMVLTAGR